MAIKHLKSQVEPTEAAIKAAQEFLLESAGPLWHRMEQFIAQAFSHGGRRYGDVYHKMCSGSLISGCDHFQQNVLAVRYLGEFNGGTHNSRTVKYVDDDPASPGHVWLEYLLSNESPYLDIFPYLVTRDAKEVYAQRGFIFKNMDVMPIAIWKCFVIAQRFVAEMPNHYTVWRRLIDRGCNPRAAHLLSVAYEINGEPDSISRTSGVDARHPLGLVFTSTWSHSAFDSPLVCLGAISQEYFGSTRTAGTNKVMKGAYDSGYSAGFRSPKWVVPETEYIIPRAGQKFYLDALMDPRYLEQGRSLGTVDDLVNQANILTLMAQGAMEYTQGRKLLDDIWDDVKSRATPEPQQAAQRSQLVFDDEDEDEYDYLNEIDEEDAA